MVSASRTCSNIIIRLVFTIFLKPLGLVMMLVSWLCQTCIYKSSMNIKLNGLFIGNVCVLQIISLGVKLKTSNIYDVLTGPKAWWSYIFLWFVWRIPHHLDKVSYSLDCWSGHKLDIIHYHRTWFSSLVLYFMSFS